MSNHVLIVYFTHSGNTRKLAELIYEKVGGELFEIQPELPYPDSYNTVVEQAKKEIGEGYQPPLKSK